MGLFDGDETISVTTPDGRTLQVPRSVAAQLQGGLEQVPYAPEPLYNAFAPPPTPQFAPPEQDAPAAQMQPGLGIPASTVDATGAIPQAQAAKPKAAKPGKATPATAPGNPLLDIGTTGALVNAQEANQGQIDAGVKAADIDAAGRLTMADAQKDRNDEIVAAEQKRQQVVEKDMQAVEAKNASIVKMRDQIANQKIDRSIDHPILAAISVALAGLGSAMKHDGAHNPALEMLFKVIDRKVAGQMADLEQKGKILGFAREELADLKDTHKTRLGIQNTLVASAAEKGARYIEEIASRTSSDKVRAEGQQLAAQLRAHGADMTTAAVQAEIQRDQQERFHKDTIGESRANRSSENWRFSEGQKNENFRHGQDLVYKYDALAADREQALASIHAKSGEAAAKQYYEQQKEVGQRGLKNLTTNDYLLTNKGKEMMSAADQMEEDAKIADVGDGHKPAETARAQALRQQAAVLRDNARVTQAVIHRDPTQAGAFGKKYAAAQDLTDLGEDIKEMYERDGRSYISTTAGQAALQAKQVAYRMALKTAWELGVLSKSDNTIIDKGAGTDVTKGWDQGNIAHAMGIDAGVDPKAFKARLDVLNKTAQDSVISELKTNSNWDSKSPEELFARRKQPEKTAADEAAVDSEADKTPLEAANDRRSANPVRNAVGRVFYPLSGSADDQASALENSGSVTHPGLSEKQGKAVDLWMTAIGKGGAAGKKAEDLVTQQALSKRTELAVATLHNVRDANPQLYAQIVKKLPPDSETAKQMAYEDEGRKTPLKAVDTTPSGAMPPIEPKQPGVAKDVAKDLVMSQVPIMQLAPQALTAGAVGDKARAELARRAAAGDKIAQKALAGVITSPGRERTYSGRNQ